MSEERIEREETTIEHGRGRGTHRKRTHIVEEVREEVPDSDPVVASDCEESDLRKPRTRRSDGSNFVTETVRRSSQAAADSAGGMIEAIGRGFRAYSDSLTNENVLRFGLNNGFVEGTVRGYAVFFEEMAATARRVLDTVAGAPELTADSDRRVVRRDASVGPPIDYDLLARLIAEQILAETASRTRPPDTEP